MANENPAPETTEASGPALPLSGMLLPSGMWLFVNDHDGVVGEVFSAHPELTTFYLLGADAKGAAQFYRVANTMAAVAVVNVEPSDVVTGLHGQRTEAYLALPSLPRVLITKIDQFFRKVAREKNTEAVVLLTFDPDHAGDPAGWGVLVPDQRNSAGHCEYEPTSVMEDKPDNVVIVGSAHSHPGMGAFASGTDHHDQEEFDGLHITFGYPVAAQGRTEFHVELQLMNRRFTYRSEQVFEAPLEEPDDPEVVEWTKKVTKAYPVVGSGFMGGPAAPNHGTDWKTLTELDDRTKRPEGCPNPNDNQIVTNISRGNYKCPVCRFHISTDSFTGRRCPNCHTFFAIEKETIAAVIAEREARHLPIADLDYEDHPESVAKTILFWRRVISGETTTSSAVEPIFRVDPPKTPPPDPDADWMEYYGGIPLG